MEWHMTWRAKFFVPFGAGLGINFSQTRASHNKLDDFGRECATFGDKTIPVACYCFQIFSSVNIEQQECCVNFWDFLGFAWTFLYINWVFYAFMCTIQIWTTCTCSIHINWLKIQICVLGCMLRSHARNGNKCQPPSHHHSVANNEIPGFKF